MLHWQPSVTQEVLKKRAELLANIRQFFTDCDVLEVDVPVLGKTTVTDIHIDSLSVQAYGGLRYLQSSPEYFMKRLLAADSGAIYFLGKTFRDGELGSRHNIEFTMLEWYRPSWDEWHLMAELTELVRFITGQQLAVAQLSYRTAFFQAVAIDPHKAELAKLQNLASQIANNDFSNESRSSCLDVVFSLVVEPQLPEGLVFVYDYPACQSALAKLSKDDAGTLIARRFEMFMNGMELANGYCELTDSVEQRTRFQADLALREATGKAPVLMDEKLLAAMDSGLPECAGVALGVDRLLMQWLGLNDIRQVMTFSE